MFYYTYLITLKDSDKYYVGRHQSKRHPDNDGYTGSGKWVKSIKDRSRLQKIVMNTFTNEEDLVKGEAILIKEHFGKPNCMNMNEFPVGFGSANNPNKTLEARERNRQRLLENNPMKGKKHTPESLEKMRQASMGNSISVEARQKISDFMKGRYVGKIWTPEQKANLSLVRKNEYATGTRINAKGMLNKQHSLESKERMKVSQADRPKLICNYCQQLIATCAYARWHGENCKKRGRSPNFINQVLP